MLVTEGYIFYTYFTTKISLPSTYIKLNYVLNCNLFGSLAFFFFVVGFGLELLSLCFGGGGVETVVFEGKLAIWLSQNLSVLAV